LFVYPYQNMESEKYVIRVLLRHYWKKGFNAAAAAREICEVEGEGMVSVRVSQLWFKRFSSGDVSLEDQPRSGRPSVVDDDTLRQAVEEQPCTSTRRLSAELGPSQPTIQRHLHQLGLVNRRCRQIPHELTATQAQQRLDLCKELLAHPHDMRFIRRIVTGDEKWIFFRNPNKENQWLYPGMPTQPVVKQGRFDCKVMLCVWWNFEGVIHFELVPEGRAVNANLYTQQLDRVYAVLCERYPALVNRNRVLLQHDNAPAHTARLTRGKVQELQGIEVLPHPAYSPDLAPSDYHLFRAMAHFLKGRQFDSVEEVEQGAVISLLPKRQSGIPVESSNWLKDG
jgi:[histone H3]-lysine36 N-dimethyltransferase SETMAR